MNNITKSLLLFIGLGLSLTSCFKDESIYEYRDIRPPKWKITLDRELVYAKGRSKGDVVFDGRGYFAWEGMDSLQRSKDVRYEWVLNDKVVAEGIYTKVPTDLVMKRAGIEDFVEGKYGLFKIIEKDTGITFMARLRINLLPPIVENDFIIYATDGKNESRGVLSSLILDYNVSADGKITEDFKITNTTQPFSGTPQELCIAQAWNVSPSGSVTAITKEGEAQVFSAGDLSKVWDIREQFLDDIIPDDFKVNARRDQETSGWYPAFTWIATKDGRVFTRQTSKNYLGGKFISDPYFIDEKGYKITTFGHTLWGITNIPCYDEKNRRIVLATSLPHHEKATFRSFINVLEKDPSIEGIPLSNMPESTKVYYLSSVASGIGRNYDEPKTSWYECFYTEEGKAKMGAFAIDIYERKFKSGSPANKRMLDLSDYTFDDETVFLVSSQVRNEESKVAQYDLFSQGNKIIAIIKAKWFANADKNEVKELEIEGITSKITCMTYDRADNRMPKYFSYKHFLVGCENGDILIYDCEKFPELKLLKRFNIGSRVVSIKQIGSNRANLDMF